MTEAEYAEFVTMVQDLVYMGDLERLMADQPRHAA